jgi:hypothetical protein
MHYLAVMAEIFMMMSLIGNVKLKGDILSFYKKRFSNEPTDKGKAQKKRRRQNRPAGRD